MKEEPKVSYITGALIGLKKNGDWYEAKFHDRHEKFIFKKALGMCVGTGYKFGIIDTDEKNKFEIVSVEQPLLTDPAFIIKGPAGNVVQMKEQHYRDLIQGKQLRIRSETLKAAVDICRSTYCEDNPEQMMKHAVKMAKDLEPYFE